jgi:hypothetical protein
VVVSVASFRRISMVCVGVGTAVRHVAIATDTLHVAGVEVASRGRMEIDVIRVVVIVGIMHGVGDVHAVGAVRWMVVASRSVDAAGGIAVVSCTVDAVVVVFALYGGDMAVGTIGVDIRVSLLAYGVEFGDSGIEALVAFCRSHADRGDSE